MNFRKPGPSDLIVSEVSLSGAGRWSLSGSMRVSVVVTAMLLIGMVDHGPALTVSSQAIQSPDGNVVIRFGMQTNGVPVYQVDYLGKPIVLESKLGLEPIFVNGMKWIATTRVQHSGSWTNFFGERRMVPDNYNGLSVDLENASGQRVRLTFRAYDEGAAFRYSFPAAGTNEFHFSGERTEFRFPAGTFGYEEHSTEGKYHCVPMGDIQPQCERPLTLVLASGLFASLTEADNQDYPRMLLSPLPGISDALVSALGGTSSNTNGDRSGRGNDPTATLRPGDSTPWRVFVLGQTPGDLLERNYLILDLNPPCVIRDTSWIKPGKVMRDMTLTTANARAIIDFAGKAGLQHVELDWGWYGRQSDDRGDATTVRAPNLDLAEIIRYGRQKGVGLILYVDYRQMRRQRDVLFPLYEKWGVKGVKIGFVAVGPQAATAWVTETIRQAAKYHLLLDIHDGYRPTGLSRTWPNLVTVEGIRGNEHMPTPEHNCTLPFTRYIAGPADYTVCYYTPRKQTTFAHQLAMAVVSFSPLQFIFWYDKPSDYHGEPEIEFFRHVPTVWDDTKVINGQIGKFATIARRSGNDWFVGTINDHTPRTLKVPLMFLDTHRAYEAHIYSDDSSVPTRTHVAVTSRQVNSETTLEVPLQPGGGQAMWIQALPK
jgi:alpha-glucosidase